MTPTALGRGLQVLEAVARARGPVRVSHLAAELGEHKSSVHRILQTLIEAGYVARDPDTDLYVATLKVWELGAAVVDALPLRRAATAVLQQLHRQTGETVSLSVLDGDDVLYLDKILAPRPMGFTTRVGTRLPALLTVAGRALLADEGDPRAAVERIAARLGRNVDVDGALDDVRFVHEEGYLVGRGRPERGVVGVAAAVPGPSGRAIAALTVSAPSATTTGARQQEIVDAVMVAAASLSEAIGA